MGFTDGVMVANASWREAARQRDPEIELPHVFLAGLALGGPGAEALAREGVSLDSARRAWRDERAARLREAGLSEAALREPATRPNADLHHEAAGDLPTAAPAEQVLKASAGTSGPRLLETLVLDPSSDVQAILARCGVSPARAREVLHAVTRSDPRPEPGTFPPPPGIDRGPLRGVSYSFFVSAPRDIVMRAATGEDGVRQWLPLADDGQLQVIGDVVRGRVGKRCVEARVVRGEDGRTVSWLETWDGVPGGWITLSAVACPGGSRVTLTRTIRTGGTFATLLAAVGCRLQGWAVRHAAQNLAFTCADLAP